MSAFDVVARALFWTDPEVLAFVATVADAGIKRLETRWSAVTMRAEVVRDVWASDSVRGDAAMQRAWDRDEHGWRSRAEERAVAVVALIGGGQ